MSNDPECAFLFGLIFGGVVGAVVGYLLVLSGLKAWMAEYHAMEERRERRDPANWWKTGSDPYASSYDDDDDHGQLA